MASQSNTCEIPEELKEEFKKFRLGKKTNAAIICKINKDKLAVEIEEQLSDVTIEQVAEYLPESAPRFLAYSYSYKHPDGRVSLPLIFIFYCPKEINPTLAMMYTSTKTKLVVDAGMTKTYDVQDSSELTESWLTEKMKFFK